MAKSEKEAGGKMAAGVSRAFDPKKEDWIGRQLRRVYDDAANEPVPDELLTLLRRLDDDKRGPT